MSALLTSLPGDIPELLRRGSPVVHVRGERDVVSELRGETHLRIAGAELLMWIGLEYWSLDLTDPTGRAHAAWWVRGWISTRGGWAGLTAATLDLLVAVCDGHPMTPAQIDALARLVLRLAGRAS